MKILLTAFEPFGGETMNPELEAVKRIADHVEDTEVIRLTVPTVFYKSIAAVSTAIETEKPDAVLCIGQAEGRCELTPERVAINLNDARIPDNEGNQLIDRPIFTDGTPAYFSTLPIKAMVRSIRNAGIPASVSNTAGTFVCNHLMYGLLHTLEKQHNGVRGRFMHVPLAPSQAANRSTPVPSLSVQDIVSGIEAAIQAIAECEYDIAAVEGMLH